MTLRSRLGAELRRRPIVAARLARSGRRAGAKRFSARVERAADLAWVAPGPDGAAPFHLHRQSGTDQVAVEVGAEGWASFERPLPAVLAALVTRFCRGALVLDVGANSGYYALLAVAVAPDVTVDAYEPYPPAEDLLRANIRVNGTDHVHVHAVAVGAEPGRATLYVPDPSHGLLETSSSLNPQFAPERPGTEIEVDVVTLDERYPAGGADPALIKIDVESLEPDVLAGGIELVTRARPLLVLELLPHADPAPLEARRSALGYVDIRLRPDTVVVGGPVVPDPDSWNHLWSPPERLDEVIETLTSVGLSTVDR